MAGYGKCTGCGGRIEERLTTQEYRIKDRIVMVIEDVPTGVCTACGDQSFLQPVLERMESLALKRESLRKVQYVPIVPFATSPATTPSA